MPPSSAWCLYTNCGRFSRVYPQGEQVSDGAVSVVLLAGGVGKRMGVRSPPLHGKALAMPVVHLHTVPELGCAHLGR